jgi:hypothetical protein
MYSLVFIFLHHFISINDFSFIAIVFFLIFIFFYFHFFWFLLYLSIQIILYLKKNMVYEILKEKKPKINMHMSVKYIIIVHDKTRQNSKNLP